MTKINKFRAIAKGFGLTVVSCGHNAFFLDECRWIKVDFRRAQRVSLEEWTQTCRNIAAQ